MQVDPITLIEEKKETFHGRQKAVIDKSGS